MAVLHLDNACGQGLDEILQARFEKLGGRVVASEKRSEGATDFSDQLGRIKDLPPVLLYLPAQTQEYPLILKQARETGLEDRIIAAEQFDDRDTVEAAGDAAEGVAQAWVGVLPRRQ